VFEVPEGTEKWDGAPLSLVVLKDHIVLIRNGEPCVLKDCAPARLRDVPGPTVFSELGPVQAATGLPWKAISTGWIERPPVH
jgi:hypothetical protein